MAGNYAYKIGRLVKVGKETSTGSRKKNHQFTSDLGALIYGLNCAEEAQELWYKGDLSTAASSSLETWMKTALRGYLRYGCEWFDASDEVLTFLKSDPYEKWRLRQRCIEVTTEGIKDALSRFYEYPRCLKCASHKVSDENPMCEGCYVKYNKGRLGGLKPIDSFRCAFCGESKEKSEMFCPCCYNSLKDIGVIKSLR